MHSPLLRSGHASLEVPGTTTHNYLEEQVTLHLLVSAFFPISFLSLARCLHLKSWHGSCCLHIQSTAHKQEGENMDYCCFLPFLVLYLLQSSRQISSHGINYHAKRKRWGKKKI